MTAIICTTIICGTVLLCTQILARSFKPEISAQQPTVSQEDLEKAYEEAEKDKAPDFQDVIEFINKEFTGIMEDNDDGR